MTNSEINRKVLDPRFSFLEQTLDEIRLWWLRHTLRKPTERLPCSAPLFDAGAGWKTVQGGRSIGRKKYEKFNQWMVSYRCSKTTGLGFTSSPKRWLETVGGMAQCLS